MKSAAWAGCSITLPPRPAAGCTLLPPPQDTKKSPEDNCHEPPNSHLPVLLCCLFITKGKIRKSRRKVKPWQRAFSPLACGLPACLGPRKDIDPKGKTQGQRKSEGLT